MEEALLTTTLVEQDNGAIELAEHIVRRGQGCPASRPWALVSKSTGRVLGCHESKGSAMRQERAIRASENCATGCTRNGQAEHRIHVAVSGSVRRETFEGRPHLVVPTVLVRSQVLHNNLGRSYLPASEITAEWAELWNGIPVLVGDHPRQHGEDVGGRNPALWDERRVGFIFGARAEQTGRDAARLIGEVWLDETRAPAVDGFQAVLEAVRAGNIVELSTGFRTQTERSAGSFGGQEYELIMHPVAPDHLIVSTEMTGACSVQDGCGLGAHAREDAAVDTKDKGIKALLARVAELFSRQPVAMSREEQDALRIQRELAAWNEMNPSDGERQQLIREALQTQFGSNENQVIVADVFTADNAVIFWYATPLGAHPKGAEFFKATFTESADHKFTFSDPVRVRRMTTYEPVATQVAEQSAGNAGVAAAVNSKQPTTGKESNMSDENKDLAAQVASLVTAVQALTGKVEAIETASKQDPNPAIAGLKGQLGKLTDEFAKMRGVTEAAVQERERERQSLIRTLVGHVRVPFNEAQLETKPLEELRMLNEMAQGINFEGRGGPQGGKGQATEAFAEPTSPWDKQTKKGGE